MLKDKDFFPSTEEEFNSSSNPTFKDNSEYSLSVVVVDDDEFKKESKTIFSSKKVKFILNELLMQWLCSKIDRSIRLKLPKLDNDLFKTPPGVVTPSLCIICL